MSRWKSIALIAAWAALGLSASCSRPASETAATVTPDITAATFGCIRNLTPVGRFYVGNLEGRLAETVAVARSRTGGVYPPGSVIQLVPTEVMVKRAPGFNAQTRDWEFFELDVAPTGSTIRRRGHVDVVNRFGGNCSECHAKAEARHDFVCSTDHGCDPIPLTEDMIRALQKTDPRCPAGQLTAEEKAALQLLAEATTGQPS
jgi:hypothetical protein